MAISKESVRVYVRALCGKRHDELQQAIDALYADTLKPVVKERIKILTGRVSEWADYIYDKLDKNRKSIEHLGGYAEYNLNQKLSSATSFSHIKSTMLSNCWNGIITYIENPSNGASDFGSTEINEMVARLQKDEILQALVKDRAAIDTLRVELSKNANLPGSGKQAYNRMVALGVDMSGYKEPMAQLPAVQKLSVDVCVLSGNC